MLRQISIFTENKKGAMLQVTQTIANAQVNIISAVTNDSAEYGIVRLIVSDPDKCYEVLKESGYLCKLTNVIAVEISEDVGSLAELLGVLDEMNVNIDYIYSANYDKKSVMILHTKETLNVENSLRRREFNIV